MNSVTAEKISPIIVLTDVISLPVNCSTRESTKVGISLRIAIIESIVKISFPRIYNTAFAGVILFIIFHIFAVSFDQLINHSLDFIN